MNAFVARSATHIRQRIESSTYCLQSYCPKGTDTPIKPTGKVRRNKSQRHIAIEISLFMGSLTIDYIQFLATLTGNEKNEAKVCSPNRVEKTTMRTV